MRIVIDDDRCALLHGDSAQLGDVLEENSVDAIVTDPPAGIGFMGKGWDSNKGGRDKWIAWLAALMAPAFRALKPGGYALVWAIPRTSHWTATALELAGFEIRDVVVHLFGTGFPKSMDISKAIDEHLGAEPIDLGVPKVHGDGKPQHSCSDEAKARSAGASQSGPTVHANATAPATPEAAQWDGWGTALKPAAEHWILCRKPLAGTYAANVLEHGVGGLNVDACRVAMSDEDREFIHKHCRPNSAGQEHVGAVMNRPTSPTVNVHDAGRWPANVTLDEDAARELDASSPPSKSRKGKPRAGKNGDGWGLTATGAEYNDAGGPSRFFYVAKPSRREKEAGLAHLPKVAGGEITGREDGSAGSLNPRAGAGARNGARNFHPTVEEHRPDALAHPADHAAGWHGARPVRGLRHHWHRGARRGRVVHRRGDDRRVHPDHRRPPTRGAKGRETMKATKIAEWEHDGKQHRLLAIANHTAGYEDRLAVEVREEDLLGQGAWRVLEEWKPTLVRPEHRDEYYPGTLRDALVSGIKALQRELNLLSAAAARLERESYVPRS